jgi:hypothetical protein
MWIGVPVRASREPACAPKARGRSSREAGVAVRIATTTTMGRRAATAPLTLITAVNNATMTIMRTIRRVWLSPARATIHCPAAVVTPVESIPALTTNSAAMKTTVVSPKPANAWSRVMTPVASNVRDAPTATNSTGTRFQMNSATTRARTM